MSEKSNQRGIVALSSKSKASSFSFTNSSNGKIHLSLSDSAHLPNRVSTLFIARPTDASVHRDITFINEGSIRLEKTTAMANNKDFLDAYLTGYPLTVHNAGTIEIVSKYETAGGDNNFDSSVGIRGFSYGDDVLVNNSGTLIVSSDTGNALGIVMSGANTRGTPDRGLRTKRDRISKRRQQRYSDAEGGHGRIDKSGGHSGGG